MRDILFGIILPLLMLTGSAEATQHLVWPGQNWSRLKAQVRPGDEIVLLPGRHVAVSLVGLTGTVEKPIVIRGFSEARPAVIGAREFGIELISPRYVTLRDLHIAGAGTVGIRITNGADTEKSAEIPFKAGVRLERISIEDTGDFETGIAFFARGVESVRMEHCTFRGWGASAVELVGCRDVSIESCSFEGTKDYLQIRGLLARADTRRLSIRRCALSGIDATPIQLGTDTDPEDYLPALTGDEAPGSRAEVSQISIEQCLIRDGKIACVFDSVRQCTVRRCTIIKPKFLLFQFVHSATDVRITPVRDISLGNNLFVWDQQSLIRPIDIARGTDPSMIRLEQNLWWAEGAAQANLGDLELNAVFPQITDVDPELGEDFRPAAEAAAAFGVRPSQRIGAVTE